MSTKLRLVPWYCNAERSPGLEVYWTPATARHANRQMDAVTADDNTRGAVGTGAVQSGERVFGATNATLSRSPGNLPVPRREDPRWDR